MSALPLPVEPDYDTQEQHYISIGAENREREYQATQFLLDLKASWIEIETALEMFWPQSSSPEYLKTWAAESLDRLSRNARQRKGTK